MIINVLWCARLRGRARMALAERARPRRSRRRKPGNRIGLGSQPSLRTGRASRERLALGEIEVSTSTNMRSPSSIELVWPRRGRSRCLVPDPAPALAAGDQAGVVDCEIDAVVVDQVNRPLGRTTAASAPGGNLARHSLAMREMASRWPRSSAILSFLAFQISARRANGQGKKSSRLRISEAFWPFWPFRPLRIDSTRGSCRRRGFDPRLWIFPLSASIGRLQNGQNGQNW